MDVRGRRTFESQAFGELEHFLKISMQLHSLLSMTSDLLPVLSDDLQFQMINRLNKGAGTNVTPQERLDTKHNLMPLKIYCDI